MIAVQQTTVKLLGERALSATETATPKKLELSLLPWNYSWTTQTCDHYILQGCGVAMSAGVELHAFFSMPGDLHSCDGLAKLWNRSRTHTRLHSSDDRGITRVTACCAWSRWIRDGRHTNVPPRFLLLRKLRVIVTDYVRMRQHGYWLQWVVGWNCEVIWCNGLNGTTQKVHAERRRVGTRCRGTDGFGINKVFARNKPAVVRKRVRRGLTGAVKSDIAEHKIFTRNQWFDSARTHDCVCKLLPGRDNLLRSMLCKVYHKSRRASILQASRVLAKN